MPQKYKYSQAITIYGAVQSVETDAGTFWSVEDLEVILGQGLVPSNMVVKFPEQTLCVQRDYVSTSNLLDVLYSSSGQKQSEVGTLIDTVRIYESIRPLR